MSNTVKICNKCNLTYVNRYIKKNILNYGS